MSKIIRGDCLQKMLPISEVDMVFTDPPFALSNKRNEKPHKGFSGYSSNKGDWDEYVPADYWVPSACGTLKPGGIFACFGTLGSLVPVFTELDLYGKLCLVCHHEPHPFSISKDGLCLICTDNQHICTFPKDKMQFQSHIIWHKTNPAPSVHRRMLTHANELILVFSKGPKWYFDYDYSKLLNNGKQCHNVFNYPAVRKMLGVTRKPVGLCEQIIRLFCPTGGTVLDPFAGSGAIPEAAAKAKRNFIAIEKRADCVSHMITELTEYL